MNQADLDLLQTALQDRDWRLHAAAICINKMLLREGRTAFMAQLLSLADEPKPNVTKQLILSPGWSDSKEATSTIETIVHNHLAHDSIYLVTMDSLWSQEPPLIRGHA
ncbi:MAG: hypothetical protein M2R45_04608 [Verrucomicrobia subdivision 3 bacterium]|nr:hypothetical protein [Limisphaerales bacterium]MCS1417329.1 hypothetical protein [Limisphaerales bacterium]